MVSINHFVLIAAIASVSLASSNLLRFRSSAGTPKVISQFSDNYVSSGQRLCLGSDNKLFAAQTFQNVSGSTGGLFSSYYGGNFSAASADYFYTVPSEYKMKGAFCGQSGSNAMSYVLTQYDIDLQHSSYMIFVIDPVTGSLLKTVTYDTSNQAGNDRVINPVHLTVDRLTGDIYVLGTNNNFQYVVTRHPGGVNNTVVAFFQIDDAAQIPTQLRTSPLAADAGIVFVLGGAQRTSVNGVAVKGVQNVFVARMNMKTPTELGITTSTTTTTTADTTSETTTTTTTTTTMLTTLMSANSTVSTVHVNMSSTFSTASLEVSTSSTESTTTTTDEATTASSSPSPVVQEFSGKPDWTFVFGTDDLDQNVGFDTPTGMSVSSDGKSLFVFGYSFGNMSSNYTNKGFQDLFVTRLSINDTGAELTWTAMYGTQFSEFLTTGTLDSSRGILHVGGNAKSPLFSGLPFYGERDMFIMSLNTTDGSVLDVWQWGLPKPFESFTRELRVDSTNGVLYVFGQSEGQLFSINKNAWGNSTSFIARIGPIIVPSSTTISAQSSLPTASLNATLTITETLSVSQVSATSTPTQTNGPIIDGNALLGALLGIWASFQWAVIAVGVVIVLLLALAIYCCCFRKRKQAKAPESFDFKPPVPVASVRGTSQVPSAEGKSDLNRRASVSSRFNVDSSASISQQQQQQQPDLFGDKFAAGSSQAMGSSSAVQRNASVRRQMSTRQTADISTAFGSIPQPNVMGSSFSNSNNFDMMASSQTGKAKVDDLDALADELQNKFDF
ncbi:hypothetical protein MP228_010832 [Amoeboaphelidium protococcarum]|nr:hypothetical protein MP228_010832 [Amoeboaphelidium protococcarum]